MMSIPLYLSTEHACSYLEGEQAQLAFVHPSCQLTTSIYTGLIEQGFRRSGDDAYKPHCTNCSACIPARLAVPRFKANRSQQRCLKKNSGTQALIKPAVFEQTHYDLFMRYQQSRHNDSNMAHSSPEDYIDFLGCSWCDTQFVEFSIAGELAAVAVIDQLDHGLSAVYTFFDPKFSSYSPGVYAVLWQIEHAKQLELDYVYLGYWIKKCAKMAYKSHFQPLQLFLGKRWTELSFSNKI